MPNYLDEFADSQPSLLSEFSDTPTTTSTSAVDSLLGSSESSWELRPYDRMKASLHNSMGALSGLAAMTASSVGYDTGRDFFISKAQEQFKEAEDFGLATTSFADIKNAEGTFDTVEQFLKFGAEGIVSYLPDMALMFLGGAGAASAGTKAASTAVGKRAAETFLKGALKKNLETITEKSLLSGAAEISASELQKMAFKATVQEAAAMAGMAAYEGSLGAGQSYLYDVEKRGAEEASAGAAALSGIGQAAVTYLSPVNRFLSSKLGGRVVTKAGLREFGEMTLGEAAEEVGQEAVTMLHEAGVDPNKQMAEAFKDEGTADRLMEAGLSGAIIGGVFGGGRYVANRDAKKIDQNQKIKEVIENPDATLAQYGIVEGATSDLTAVKEGLKGTTVPMYDEWSRQYDEALSYLKEKNVKIPEELKKAEAEYKAYEPTAPLGLQGAVATTAPAMVEPSASIESLQSDLEWKKQTEAALERNRTANVKTGWIYNQTEYIEARNRNINRTIDESMDIIEATVADKATFQKVRDAVTANPTEDTQKDLAAISTAIQVDTKKKGQLKKAVVERNDFAITEVNKVVQDLTVKQKEVTPKIEQKVEEVTTLPETTERQKETAPLSVSPTTEEMKTSEVKKPLAEEKPLAEQARPMAREDVTASITEGRLYSGEAVSPSPEVALERAQEQKIEEETEEPEIAGRLSLRDISKRIPDPLVQALILNRQEDISAELGKFSLRDRKKALDAAKETALPLAKAYGISGRLESSYTEAHELNTKREGTRDTWKEEVKDMVYSSPDGAYRVQSNPEAKSGSRWELYSVDTGELISKHKTSTQARAAAPVIKIKENRKAPTKVERRAEEINVLKEAAESFALPKVNGSMLVSHLKGSKHNHVAALAKAISAIIPKEKLQEVNVETSEGGSFYSAKQNVISLEKGSADIVIMHELVHSLTSREMDQNPKLAQEVSAIRDTLAQYIKDEEIENLSDDVKYALGSPKEFIAVATTSLEVQQLLKEIPAQKPKGAIKTLWDALLNIIGKALGLSPTQYTQLDRLMTSFAQLAQTEVKSEGALLADVLSSAPTKEQIAEAQRQYDNVVAETRGTDKWMKAPNGKDTTLNERQWVQTQTQAFKDWFGDSKVLNENGEPLIVYHGSPEVFTVFDKGQTKRATGHTSSGLGHFFTTDRSLAYKYSGEGYGNIISAYLTIKNPYPISLREAQSFETLKKSEEFQASLIEKGYDGIFFQVPGMKDQWIAFNSNDIKSSTTNAGLFSRISNDINYMVGSLRGATEKELSMKEKAAQMLNEGKSKEEVKKETGWFRRDDGHFRYHISTSDVKVSDTFKDTIENVLDGKDRGKVMSLGDLITNAGETELYQRYGDLLKDVKVTMSFDPKTAFVGSANPQKKTITLNFFNMFGKDKQKVSMETLLHEIQHIIQDHEGLSTGGTFTVIKKLISQIKLKALQGYLKREGKEKELRELEMAIEESTAVFEEYVQEDTPPSLLNTAIAEDALNSLMESSPKWEMMMEDNQVISDLALIESIEDNLKFIKDPKKKEDLQSIQESLLFTYYEALLGEVEAREASEQWHLSGRELAEVIPEDTMVEINEDGESFSIPLIALSSNDIDLPTVISASIPGSKGDSVYKTKDGKFYLKEWKGEDVGYKDTEISSTQYTTKKEELRQERNQKVAQVTQEHPTGVTDVLGKVGEDATRFFKDIAASISGRISRISPEVGKLLMKFEHKLNIDQARYKALIRPFAKKFNKISHAADKAIFKSAWINGDQETLNELLTKYNMQEDFKLVRKMLDELQQRYKDTGMIMDTIEDYLPRRVVDYDGLMAHMLEADPKTFSKVQLEIAEKEKRTGEKLSDTEKADVVTNILKSGNYNYIPKPGSAKDRTISYVTPQMLQYYADPVTTLFEHIFEGTEAANFRELITGDTPRKTLMKRLSTISRELEGMKDGVKKEPLLTEWDSISEKLEDIEKDTTETISAFIATSKVPPENQAEVIELIRARIKQKGAYGITNTVRNALYMTTLGSPLSAITQLGDLAFSLYKNGPIETFSGVGKAVASLVKGEGFTQQIFDFAHSTQDFPVGKSAAILDKVLHYSGLKGMDLLGKEVAMRSTLNKWTKVAERGDYNTFKEKWGDTLTSDTLATYNDLKAGKMSDNVLFMLFNDLSDFQPISLSAMPKTYLTSGNGRIFYMLKSFTLTFLNGAYKEVHGEIKKGNNGKAATKLVYLLALASMAGAGADELKDFIQGKESSFKDNTIDNMWQLLLLNKFSLDKGIKGDSLVSSIVNGWMPPWRVADDFVADVSSAFIKDKEFKFKSLRNVPLVGKVAYSYSEAGISGRLSVERNEIYRKVREGASIASLRQDIARHNREALKLGDKELLIKYDQLKKKAKEKNKKTKEKR